MSCHTFDVSHLECSAARLLPLRCYRRRYQSLRLILREEEARLTTLSSSVNRAPVRFSTKLLSFVYGSVKTSLGQKLAHEKDSAN